ncbi:hypothetical protein LOTGIDRAFT_160948 [Lottia gigantea]|uniref:Uncharacterized protein n=1 Tax=Lottia gigantea TaxID=225164 RepID=V4AHN5_LOTGI|nr:hypothetical protein LOTGIDRAFT_160948 [Lottia gigantea]ESO94715.1 hypothetical protein LOTGIDRAFT_160948 [Lottia gigantea]
MALHCIRHQSNGTAEYHAESDFIQIMSELVIQPILDHLLSCEKNNTSLMLAIFVIMLANQFEMKLNLENQDIVYKNLLVQVNCEEKKCLSSEFIVENLDKKYVCEQILNFIKQQPDVKDRICVCTWLYAAPLVHFLSGHVYPFSKIPVDVCHLSPEWWCFPDFEQRKNTLKNYKWNNVTKHKTILWNITHFFNKVGHIMFQHSIHLSSSDVMARE